MALFNVFSDPVVAAQQAQLDGQWQALNVVQDQCNQIPTTALVEFYNDLQAWNTFYASGSDWSASSKNATNDWQKKAQEWSNKFTGWSCGNTPGIIAPDTGTSLIPGVKDPPPDDPGLLAGLKSDALAPINAIESYIRAAGWIAVGLVVLVVGAIVYISTRGKVSGYGLTVGGKS